VANHASKQKKRKYNLTITPPYTAIENRDYAGACYAPILYLNIDGVIQMTVGELIELLQNEDYHLEVRIPSPTGGWYSPFDVTKDTDSNKVEIQ